VNPDWLAIGVIVVLIGAFFVGACWDDWRTR
jgi:hypothetical protein